MKFSSKEIYLEFIKEIFTISLVFVGMADLAQRVRASDCGPEVHGFESHSPPHRIKPKAELNSVFFLFCQFYPIKKV